MINKVYWSDAHDIPVLISPYGRTFFCDCMNPEYGIQQIPEQSYDKCFTDPPYGIKYKKPSGLGEKVGVWTDKTKLYDDSLTGKPYQAWCQIWMDELLRICNNVIFTPGNPNLKFWVSNYDPYDLLIWYKKNSQSGGKAAWLLRHEIILIMRKNWPNKFKESVFNIYVRNGANNKYEYNHPAPKTYELWESLIKQSKPESVIDPFLGSGTTGEVCESLGIPWVGYEKNLEYKDDIEKRVRRGVYKHKQQNLNSFLENLK